MSKQNLDSKKLLQQIKNLLLQLESKRTELAAEVIKLKELNKKNN